MTGQDHSLEFTLKEDLDLATEPNFHIPYLAGEFDGNRHRISNLSLNRAFIPELGLFGSVAHGAKITQADVENVDIFTDSGYIRGLAGHNLGATVSKSYSTGRVSGGWIVGGLVDESWGTADNPHSGASVISGGRSGGLIGWNNGGTVRDSYSISSVTGHWDEFSGLVGRNNGPVSESCSTGSVSGNSSVGGLVRINVAKGVISRSFYDRETSGMEVSDHRRGNTTTETQDIATLSGAGWNMIAVANSSAHNLSYTQNIVDGETYPFLSWQP